MCNLWKDIECKVSNLVNNGAGFLIANAIKYAFLSEEPASNSSHSNFVLSEYIDESSSGPNLMSNRIRFLKGNWKNDKHSKKMVNKVHLL